MGPLPSPGFEDIVILLVNCTLLSEDVQMFLQQQPPPSKLCGQYLFCFIFCVHLSCVPIQPQSIIFDGITTTNPHIIPVHQVQQKVMNAAACDEYLLAILNISVVKSVIQNPPPLF